MSALTQTTVQQPDPRASRLDGWRELIDFLAAHPAVPLPHHYLGNDAFIYLVSGDQRAELAAITRAMGRVEKHVEGNRYRVSRRFGVITLIAQADRDQVCERVVTGTREVTEEVPDPDALAAVPKVTVTKTVEDVEWRCMPLLAEASS